jgi:hypothetical protein
MELEFVTVSVIVLHLSLLDYNCCFCGCMQGTTRPLAEIKERSDSSGRNQIRHHGQHVHVCFLNEHDDFLNNPLALYLSLYGSKYCHSHQCI